MGRTGREHRLRSAPARRARGEQTEEQLRESEARLRALVEASPLGIAVMDLDGRPIFYNPRCEELHGITFDEAGGEGWSLAVHPEDRERIVSSWGQAAREVLPWAQTYRFLHRDGRIVWISGRAAPMRVNERHTGFVGTLEDITSLKLAEGREREARRQAERVAQQRDEMLAIVAHDLRNPLHTLMMLVMRLMKNAARDAPDDSRELDIMLRTVNGMEKLIRDLLDVSKIEAGRFGVERRSLNLCDVLTETIQLFDAQAAEARIRLTQHAPTDLPVVAGDHDRLLQVLSNIVGNAIKFTPPGGLVHLDAQAGGVDVQVCVRDSGAGIPAENLASIFDRYWQASRTSRAGAGLGLAIAKGIVEAHNGRIWAESEVGRGSAFRFTIPRVECTAEDRQ